MFEQCKKDITDNKLTWSTVNMMTRSSVPDKHSIGEINDRKDMLKHITSHHDKEAYIRDKQRPLLPIVMSGCAISGIIALTNNDPPFILVGSCLVGAAAYVVQSKRDRQLEQAEFRLEMIRKLENTIM
jgi:hypothetical protein